MSVRHAATTAVAGVGAQEAHERRDADEPLVLGDHRHLVEVLGELLVEALQRLEHVPGRPPLARAEELGGHEAARRVLAEREQLADVLRVVLLHRLEHRLGALLRQVAQDVGRLVGRHLLEEVGRPLGVDLLDDGGLHLGLGLRKRLRCRLGVEVRDDRLALDAAEVLDDVGEVGGVHAGELLVDLEADRGRARVDEADVVPRDVLLREPGGEAADETRAHDAGEQPPHGAGEADLDAAQEEPAALALEDDVVHADDLPPVDVDDLAVEHVAPQGERLALGDGGVRGEEGGALVENDASLVRRERVDRAPRDGGPLAALTDHEPLDAGLPRVHDDVVEPSHAPVRGVDDRQVEHLGDVDHAARRSRASLPQGAGRDGAAEERGCARKQEKGAGARRRPS